MNLHLRTGQVLLILGIPLLTLGFIYPELRFPDYRLQIFIGAILTTLGVIEHIYGFRKERRKGV